MKQNKKGFTVVELIIVIAIIAILAAVLIPTFANIIKYSNESKDTQLIRNLNTALRIDKPDGKHPTMQSALDAAEASGYTVEKINRAATDNEILWDQENDVFCYFVKGENGAADSIEYIPDSVEAAKKLAADSYKLWIISSDVHQTFSTYYTGSETAITTSKGFDAGTSTTVTKVEYTNNVSAQEVVIRTNGGTLTIDAENDTVYHYGAANVVDIQKVATTSYYENGKVVFVKIAQGRIVVAENEAVEVGGIHVAANDVIVAVVNNVELPKVTFENTVANFKVQTTNVKGDKQSESTVTIGTTVVVSDGEGAVSASIQAMLETEDATEKQATEEQAKAAATEVVAPVLDEKYVARIGMTGYETMTAAYTASQNGDVIVLLKNVDQIYPGFSKNFIIDLNGKTVGGAEMSGKKPQDVAAISFTLPTRGERSLVIKGDGDVYANRWTTSTTYVYSGAYLNTDETHTVLFEGGTYHFEVPAQFLGEKASVLNDDDNLNNLVIGTGASISKGNFCEVTYITAANAATYKFLGENDVYYANISTAISGGNSTVYLNNGSAFKNLDISQQSNTENHPLTINLNGKTIDVVSVSGNYPIYIRQNTTLTIEGEGTINLNHDQPLFYLNKNTSTITIKGGTFNAAENSYMVNASFKGTLLIEGGSFNIASFVKPNNNLNGTISITGGTFSANPTAVETGNGTKSLVADGYTAIDNGNGTWTVVENAQ